MMYGLFTSTLLFGIFQVIYNEQVFNVVKQQLWTNCFLQFLNNKKMLPL